MKTSNIILGCVAFFKIVNGDIVNCMEGLPCKQFCKEDQLSKPTEDVIVKTKASIDSLIPNLLNDKNSKPRTFDEKNVLALFELLLNCKNIALADHLSLVDYTKEKLRSFYKDDLFARECGIIYIMSKIYDHAKRAVLRYSSSQNFLVEFSDLFSFTEWRLSTLANTNNIHEKILTSLDV